MRLFGRKSKEERPLCFHEWKVADVMVEYEYNGVAEDSVDYYETGCVNCGKIRKVDRYEYLRMCNAGMIAGDA